MEKQLNLGNTPTLVASGIALLLAYILISNITRAGSLERKLKSLQMPYVAVENGDSIAALEKGTKKYRDEPFILATQSPKIILPNVFLQELKGLPQDVLSLRREVFDKMHGRYTTLGTDHPIGIQAIRTDLTNNIGVILPQLQEESAFALEREFAPAIKTAMWQQLTIYDKLLQLSALVNGRMFVGLPLSRNQKWIDISLAYTMSMVQNIRRIQHIPSLLRPFVVPFTSEMRSLRRLQQDAARILRPHYDELLASLNADGTDTQKKTANRQYNLIHWMLNQMKIQNARDDFDHLVHEQLFAGFGSIHATSITVANAIFDLAANPQFIAPLREEIKQVLGSEPDRVLRKTSLPKFRKMDSLLRESQRMNPGNLIAWGRRVVAKEGIKLSNGQTLPADATIGFMHPFAPYVQTPPNLKGPLDYDSGQPPLDTFYPFRSSELRELPGQENAHQFTQTGNDNLNFGHGAMSCPGRFFASAEAKCILIEFLRRYDVALGPNGEGVGGPNNLNRPKNIVMPGSMQVLPNFTTPIFLKQIPDLLGEDS